MRKTMKKLTQGATRLLVLALGLGLVSTGWADFAKTNPVTGETENYTWKFVGTDTWDGTGNWQNSSSAKPSGTPAKTGENTWDPILFDGNTININASMSVEGWNLRMGLYNGANVTMNTFVKYQGDTTMWMTVDENSQLTIGGFGGGNITANQVIKLSVAKTNGITWTANLTSGNANNTFEYYLKGAGSVSYQAVSAANHKIKMADVTLSGGSKSVQSKTLVSKGNTSTVTFTADAIIKVLNSNGDLVVSKRLGTVNTTGTTTLTTANKVGTCELVQTSTGVVLYWVDGDPAEAAYTCSININFTHSGSGLTTSADVGLSGYAVPGTAWNNFAGVNATYSTVNAVDSTGAASVASDVSVTVSGTRGSYRCNNLAPANNPLHGYIDEAAGNMTPTVTITGIPYNNYRVIVYHATDSGNSPFGYDTINGTNFTYVNGVQAIGTESWGDSGVYDGANPIAEGVNTLVSGILSGSTVTMVAHRIGSSTPSARGCFAAIQVVKVDVGEGNLLIPVTGDTTYTVSEDASFTKVIISGTGTLTLEGSSRITADVLEIDNNSAIVMNESRLAATTVIGEGAAIYDGALPPAGKGWTDSAWKGRLWLKNNSLTGLAINSYGNSGSTLVFTGIAGYFPQEKFVINPAIELVDDGETKALTVNNGFSYNSTGGYPYAKISKLKGSGTLVCKDSSETVLIWVVEANAFTGEFSMTNKAVYLGDAIPEEGATITKGTVVVKKGVTMTCPSSANWGVSTGTMRIDGTLTVDGFVWSVGGIQVDGELRAPNLGKFGSGTTITTTDNGIFTLTDSNNTQDHAVDYARITGTGTLRYADVSGKWRTLSRVNFPTNMVCENNLSEGLILQAANTEHVIGSLAGSGSMRSDWGGTQNVGDRSLKILQAKDTVYSGLFHSDDRITTVTVAPGVSSAGTLTLSNTQTVSNDLAIVSGAKVNLTGTWVGATTVAGTFGGTGTLTGGLTFSNGATFKAYATDADGLSVSGTVSCPAEGTVTVDVSDLTLTADVALLTASNLIKDKFTLTGAPENSTLEVVEGVLTLKLPVTITVPAVANATATATIAGEPITLDANGQAVVPAGSVVTVTYAADSGYQISGTTEYTIDTASATTFDPSQTTQVAAIVATITSADGQTVTPYTSVATAFTSVDDDETLTLTTNYTLTENVEITKSFTLAGSGDVTVSAGGFHFVVTDDAEFAIAGSVTVSAQVWIASTTCTVKVPSTASTVVRNDTSLPMIDGYMLRYSTDEGVKTYWIIQQFVLNVNYSNCAAYLDAEHQTPLGYTPVDDGSTIQFVVVPNEGYESPTVTANNTPVAPDGEGWYAVTVDGANVTLVISATIKTFTLTIPVVEHATAVVKVGGVATDERTFDYGTDITVEWTAASGYKITGGATQTINDIAANTTADTPTVEEMSAAVSNVNFTYGADYTTAEVTATITGEATSATLSYGGNTYNAQVSNGTATFTDVAVSRDSGNIYAPVSYTITTDAHATTGGTGSAVAADTTAWFSQSSANSGNPVNGSWTTEVNLSTPANVTDNTFEATAPSTSSRVVLEFNVCFSSTSEEDVSGEAQAAIKLGVVNSVTTFMVLTNGNEWAAVSAAGLEPDASATYKVVLTIDYGSNAYGVTVGNYVLTNSAGVASFPLAANRSSVQNIDFAGSGTLTSLKGDQVEGYMVVDKNGTRYPSIAAAISAYTQDPSIGPLRVLHSGTAPSGWKIDGDTLIKVAKGLFFMAY